jgi:hypothetical protein
MAWDTDGLGFNFWRAGENFSFHRIQIGSGFHPDSYEMGTGGFFKEVGVKRPDLNRPVIAM